jgi:hypothetical protein
LYRTKDVNHQGEAWRGRAPTTDCPPSAARSQTNGFILEKPRATADGAAASRRTATGYPKRIRSPGQYVTRSARGPPFTNTQDEIDLAVDSLDQALDIIDDKFVKK